MKKNDKIFNGVKILNLGLDNSVLNKGSNLAKRIIEYGNIVDKYAIVVLAKEDKVIELSGKVSVYGVKAGGKIQGLLKINQLAKKLIKENKFNVVTVQDQYYLGYIALKLAKKFKIGLEIQVHGFEKYSGLRKMIAKYVIPRADSIRVVSQRLKNRMIDEFRVREERINVVPIFIKPSSMLVSESFGDDQNDKVIFLTIGRLVPVKNIEMQIGVMAEVVKEHKNTELWIIGEGELSQKLKVKSQKLGIDNYIKFLGWQDDVKKYYEQANVFLLTSHSEGWPLVILEAAGYGLPIVMTDTGSAGELIINNESGIVIPINDEAKLKEAMIDLIKNPELRKKFGEGAKEAVNNLPTKEQILDMYKKSWELAAGK